VRIAYPDSFLKLLLLGFALVMLPLLFAFANAALYLDRLAEQSRTTVYHAVEATRASRMLAEQLAVMERSVRQYLVLGEATLLEHYQAAHNKFGQSARTLQRLPLDPDQQRQLLQVASREAALNERIAAGISSTSADALVSEFVNLADMAQTIVYANNQLIDRESARLAQTAERTQSMLLWQLLPLLPVALLVAAIITYLLTRPLRLMDAAIRRLGRGEYQQAISIDGPGDLSRLGERLDWLRSQLLDLDEQKKRFLRHVSHELKTPLTAIREASELLTEEVGGPLSAQQKEITSILRDNSLRLQSMIESLLSYTALQYKLPAINIEVVNCRMLVQEVLAMHELSISTKEIKALPSLTDVTVRGDREKLFTVVDNLLSNAVKFTPKGGTIGIRLSRTEQTAVLDIFDSGPGIAPLDRERLFEPFYRGGGVHDGLISGTGLGLSIAREYVTAHGGTIALEKSKQGARFRVTLPLTFKG
jgi:two-component system sensor histidine kinase GlrK